MNALLLMPMVDASARADTKLSVMLTPMMTCATAAINAAHTVTYIYQG